MAGGALVYHCQGSPATNYLSLVSVSHLSGVGFPIVTPARTRNAGGSEEMGATSCIMDIVRAVSSPSSRLRTIGYYSNTARKHLVYILRMLKENGPSGKTVRDNFDNLSIIIEIIELSRIV
jgi:hypothetical protein